MERDKNTLSRSAAKIMVKVHGHGMKSFVEFVKVVSATSNKGFLVTDELSQMT